MSSTNKKCSTCHSAAETGFLNLVMGRGDCRWTPCREPHDQQNFKNILKLYILYQNNHETEKNSIKQNIKKLVTDNELFQY